MKTDNADRSVLLAKGIAGKGRAFGSATFVDHVITSAPARENSSVMVNPCSFGNVDSTGYERGHDIAASEGGGAAVSPGRRLGPYEIVSSLGAGGMGEIYKATDVRLGRSVAIKVLPAHKASDPDRLRRFEQEARAGSALSHPNIMAVYDVGQSGSTPYIASELVEGQTLRDLLTPGALPTRRLLEIGLQMAAGLAAAHESGVIHRDLKPDNVMVTRHGLVKILDFGLAKVPPPPSGSADSALDTQAAVVTRFGEIVGTAGYMSPEQARGEPLDFRSDQFSLGAVLYEMATGRRAFQRGTYIDTLCAILIDQPEPIARIQPGVPPPLRWIIERCLAKKAEGRYPSTRDIARELRDLKEHLGDSRGPLPASTGDEMATRPLSPLGALLVAVGVAAVSWLFVGGRRGSPRQPNFGWR